MSELNPSGNIKPFRVVRAEDLGIRGTVLEQMIRDKKCIICGHVADREVWCYEKSGEEKNNKVSKTNAACSAECGEMIAWRQ